MNRFILLFLLLVFGIASGQQSDYVDFTRINADIHFKTEEGQVGLTAKYTFRILRDIDSIYLDAAHVYQYEVRDKNFKGADTFKDNRLIIKNNDGGFKADQTYEFTLDWFSYPKKALYFIDWENEGRNQIWTQGQGKYTSNWLPSIDDMNDKIEFDLSITFKKDYEVVANGALSSVQENDSTKTWNFNMNKPMSSYLVALAIGKYNSTSETSKSGIPLEYFYYPEDSAKVEATFRYSKQMFDFIENEIGVPYPWELYKQVPVKDFLYSGMENTSITIFSDALMTDTIGFADRNYVNVNAHELAHQWFGDLVTETSGTHHWLQEGFATYYALLAERNLFGEEYYYWRLYEYAQQLLEQEKAEESTALLDPKSSSLTFYQKGCWALHILREQVGDESFKKAIKNYLLKFQYNNVQTSDFIREVEQASGQDLSEFVKVWLERVALPEDVMVKSLKQSAFIREYLEADCYTYPSKCDDYLVSDISDKAKIKILSQENYVIKNEDFNNSVEVRQAIAQNLTEIPSELKHNYESLLSDKSYLTIETALYNLWLNFPEDRAKYLQKTRDLIGFSDYNIRLLWLALHLNTIEYQSNIKQGVFEELKGYTSPKYGFQLRMNAFGYLKLINGFDAFSLRNLIDATHHHNWRFQQYSKGLLEELRKNEEYHPIIEGFEN